MMGRTAIFAKFFSNNYLSSLRIVCFIKKSCNLKAIYRKPKAVGCSRFHKGYLFFLQLTIKKKKKCQSVPYAKQRINQERNTNKFLSFRKEPAELWLQFDLAEHYCPLLQNTLHPRRLVSQVASFAGKITWRIISTTGMHNYSMFSPEGIILWQ